MGRKKIHNLISIFSELSRKYLLKEIQSQETAVCSEDSDKVYVKKSTYIFAIFLINTFDFYISAYNKGNLLSLNNKVYIFLSSMFFFHYCDS